jgi:hypothetical protein
MREDEEATVRTPSPANAALNHNEEARASLQDVIRIDPKFCAERYARSHPYKDPAQAKHVLKLMLKAGLPE